MIDAVMRQITAYQLQDLRCQRCKNVKAGHLHLICECSGPYSTAETRAEFIRRLNITRGVAEYYGLDLLADAANFALNSSHRI